MLTLTAILFWLLAQDDPVTAAPRGAALPQRSLRAAEECPGLARADLSTPAETPRALEDIPRQDARLVRAAQGCIAVFRTADDQVLALDDRRPHRGGPPSEGIVHGTAVTCPLHHWVFALNSGMPQGADKGAVPTHVVRVEAGRILIAAAAVRRNAAA